MDELTLLRQVRAEIDEPSAQALADGRAALEAAWAGETDASPKRAAPKRGPRRAWRRAGWTAGGAALAFAVAGVLVAVNVFGFGGSNLGATKAEASVAAVKALNSAVVAVKATDPTVPAGHYLEITTHSVFSVSGNIPNTKTFGAFLQQQTDSAYVPADQSKTWIWQRGQGSFYRSLDANGRAFADAYYHSMPQLPLGTEWVAGPGGCYYGGNDGTGVNSTDRNGNENCAPETNAADLAALPRDPAALLQADYAFGKKNNPNDAAPDATAYRWLVDRLVANAVPADLREAMFQALTLIPGVDVTDRQANLDGRSGIAIGFTGPDADNDFREDVIIDRSTGQVIGQREVQTKADEAGVAVGTVIGWTAVTTKVVATAPHATPDGGFDSTGCTQNDRNGWSCPSS